MKPSTYRLPPLHNFFRKFGASTLTSWRTFGRSWVSLKHNWGHFGATTSIYLDFDCFLLPILKVFQVPWTKQMYLPMLGSVFLVNQGFRRRSLAKTTFTKVGIVMIAGSTFPDFGWLWDNKSWLLLKIGLKFDGWLVRGTLWHHQILATRQVKGKMVHPRA